MLEPIQAAKKICGGMLADYEQAQRIAQKVAEARAVQEALATGRPVPAVAVESAKTDGISFRSTWRVNVTDLGTLLKWIDSGQRWEFLDVKVGELERYVTKTKGQVQIPGCTLTEERITAGRAV
jgi:hypothetical protein